MLDLASATTVADVKAAKSSPPPLLPKNYQVLLQMLTVYIMLLKVLCGSRCFLLVEVEEMHHILHERIDLFECLSPPDIAQLLWAVFLDAWDFFAKDFDGKGNPPTLGLHYTVGLLLGGQHSSKTKLSLDSASL